MRSEDLVTQQEWDELNQEVHDLATGKLSAVEDLLNNELPEGFYVKVDE